MSSLSSGTSTKTRRGYDLTRLHCLSQGAYSAEFPVDIILLQIAALVLSVLHAIFEAVDAGVLLGTGSREKCWHSLKSKVQERNRGAS